MPAATATATVAARTAASAEVTAAATGTTATAARRQGRHGTRGRSGSKAALVPVFAAAFSSAMVIAPAIGRHQVVRPPTAVIDAVGFIVTAAVVIPISAIGDDAARGEDGKGPRYGNENRPAQDSVVHLSTPLSSFSVHSSKPKGAPSESATTATLPP